jgi:glutamate-1-semialdehyde 2,1-aminomutase
VFVSGTFWGFAPGLAAALANLELLDAAACSHMAAMGTRLCTGLGELAAARGLELRVSGPPALPLLQFADDPEHALACAFSEAMARRGVLVHPTHNWFLSLAHTPADIDFTLERAGQAMAAMAAR